MTPYILFYFWSLQEILDIVHVQYPIASFNCFENIKCFPTYCIDLVVFLTHLHLFIIEFILFGWYTVYIPTYEFAKK